MSFEPDNDESQTSIEDLLRLILEEMRRIRYMLSTELDEDE